MLVLRRLYMQTAQATFEGISIIRTIHVHIHIEDCLPRSEANTCHEEYFCFASNTYRMNKFLYELCYRKCAYLLFPFNPR